MTSPSSTSSTRPLADLSSAAEGMGEAAGLTPRRVVERLDRFIVGQGKAKRAVAIALRNRWRRQQVDESIRDEISPKNIIMVGATGVGKTEIARRLAKLSGAPFVKVEVSKFTEVGYVGRDVDSIIRDLVEDSVHLVRREFEAEVMEEAQSRAVERVLDLLLPPAKPAGSGNAGFADRADTASDPAAASSTATREKLRAMLAAGKLKDREVEIDVEDEQPGGGFQLLTPGQGGNELLGQQLQDVLGQLGRRRQQQKVKLDRAVEILARQEAGKLVDRARVHSEAVRRAEQLGVVFLDEIDKICGRENKSGVDVSREGVQRDLLPLVEGNTVSTKYGTVRSDHILFIAAGAFHLAKVSDLIPELQGRFPIRVELDALTAGDFEKILRDTDNSLLKQYAALLATEGVILEFADDAIAALADVASRANEMLENIGARRLHTVLEQVLEELSFEATEIEGQTVTITEAYITERVDALMKDQDLSRHIL